MGVSRSNIYCRLSLKLAAFNHSGFPSLAAWGNLGVLGDESFRGSLEEAVRSCPVHVCRTRTGAYRSRVHRRAHTRTLRVVSAAKSFISGTISGLSVLVNCCLHLC